jgi:hypothetical protein
MSTPVLSASSPRDLLAFIPYALGFVPSQSLVLACLRGRRAGLVLRHDLPRGASREVIDEVVGASCAHAVKDGAERVVAVVYSEQPVPGALVAALRSACDEADIGLLDLLHCGRDTYRSLVCEDHGCCPLQGRPLSEVTASPIGAEMVYRGVTALPTREDVLGDLSPLPASVRDDVIRGIQAELDRWGGWPLALRARRVQALARWRTAIQAWPRPPAAAVAGQLLAVLQDIRFRDAVMASVVPDCGDAPERLLDGIDDAVVSDVLGSIFGARGRRQRVREPDAEHCARVEGVLRYLARACPGRLAVPPLTVLAWLAWWQGQGALANQLVERSLAFDEDYSLTALVATALSGGVAPPWAVARRAEADAV